MFGCVFVSLGPTWSRRAIRFVIARSVKVDTRHRRTRPDRPGNPHEAPHCDSGRNLPARDDMRVVPFRSATAREF